MTATTSSGDLQAQLVVAQAALQIAEAENENLRAALVTARAIGAAVGIIMARAQLTYDAAFNVLALASQNRNRKLRELAEDVLLTGAL